MKFFEIGEIVKAHGLKGRMKVKSYADAEEDLDSLGEVLIARGNDEPVNHPVRKIDSHLTFFFLELETVNTVEEAQKFVGCRVLIPEDARAQLSADEYYWRDLIGLRVLTEEGSYLGSIESIFATGSNDVYVCSGGEREILLPAISDVIRKIDLEKQEMVVRLLKGL
ncbi:16S rRNA processing protein RimM [Syntrophus gentianae]|uniref:Ribosome maturation factor RimM n=1 Tax=Syntrophus gentianae TaxID=43775 RepID=A0A1H7YNZ3_9BACT|nr:ribosome maturation factor RimM [Syntrophus gentianae]SEM47952.1 16S rRNA processing protein RimM [Syntrophus gentianae]